MSTALAVCPAEQVIDSCDVAERFLSHTANIGVIGMGYVGLPLALMFAEQGFPVMGFDQDRNRTATLAAGKSYLRTVPDHSVATARGTHFNATADMELLADMDAVIICVPTPVDDHCEPDLGLLVKAASTVAQHLREGQLIVLQSTSFPGTTDEILVPILEQNNHCGLHACRRDPGGPDEFFVAFSPEREDPGNTEYTRSCVPKLIGGLTSETAGLASMLYGTVFHDVVTVSSPKTAEMAKLLENSYRFVNIGLVNEVNLLCDRMGIDMWEVIEAASTKPFGFQAFFPGPGIGGHCIPVDPLYLTWKAKEFDVTLRSIEVAQEINESMPMRVVDSIRDRLRERGTALEGSHVLLLGAAYKKNIDDVRESPFFKIFDRLCEAGSVVSYHDPYVPTVRIDGDVQLKSVPLTGVSQYDAVVLLTDHTVFQCDAIAKEARLFVDTRGAVRAARSHVPAPC